MRTKKNNPIDWLFPEVRRKVLALILTSPHERWYLRDIERRTDLAVGTVRRELTGLTKAEIITRTKDGNRTYYQANTNCPFFRELSGLLRKTAGMVEVLREALTPLSNKVKIAFVYGSFAKGSAKAASDVDLMIIGPCRFSEAVDVLNKAQAKLNRQINPTVSPVNEWREKIKNKHHFMTSVYKSEKIFLIGNADDLERLAH